MRYFVINYCLNSVYTDRASHYWYAPKEGERRERTGFVPQVGANLDDMLCEHYERAAQYHDSIRSQVPGLFVIALPCPGEVLRRSGSAWPLRFYFLFNAAAIELIVSINIGGIDPHYSIFFHSDERGGRDN
jgi:hypothetical protein